MSVADEVPQTATQGDIEPEEGVSLKAAFMLAWRCWPYYRPQLKHLSTFILLNVLMGTGILVAAVIGSDLVENKILLGERLEPMQASMLLLDENLVTTGKINEPPLTADQRRQVRFAVLVLGCLLTVVALLAGVLVWYYMTWIFQQINQQLRVEMLTNAEHLSLRYHNQARTGDAIYRVYQDSATITNVLRYMVLSPLRIVAWGGFGLVLLLMFSPWLGLFFLAATIPTYFLMSYFIPKVRTAAKLSRQCNSDLTSRIQETLAAIRVIKASGAEDRLMTQFDRDSQQALDFAYQMRLHTALLTVGVAVVGLTCVLMAEYFMSTWAINETPTYFGGSIALVGFAVWNLGAFKAATSRSEDLASQVWELAFFWCTVQDIIVGLRRSFYLLDIEPEVVDAKDPETFPKLLQQVRFDALQFSYLPGQEILKQASLSANESTITAIVGGTGAGKSTLMSMLLRLYDPDEGDVYINDLNLKEILIADIRSNVAIALQQNVLFAMSVTDNIRFGCPNASQVEVEAAAKVACADEFIRLLPDGYATELGERGGKLSTGQRQRLSIARAILRDTPVLILDEPTASLDAETERRVMRNLAEWGRSRVLFVITHRLSTIRDANQIAFLENGVISESGSHQELLDLNGSYAGFVAAELGHGAGM